MITSLYGAFFAFKQSPWLRGVRCLFGGLLESFPSGDLVHWLPTSDRRAAPVQSCTETFVDGELVEVESPVALSKGASLYLQVQAAGEEVYPALEELLRKVLLALFETLEGEVNFELGEGRWVEVEGASDAGIGYVLDIRVLVPVLKWNEKCSISRVVVNPGEG